jgi:hypothetical protein
MEGTMHSNLPLTLTETQPSTTDLILPYAVNMIRIASTDPKGFYSGDYVLIFFIDTARKAEKVPLHFKADYNTRLVDIDLYLPKGTRLIFHIQKKQDLKITTFFNKPKLNAFGEYEN